MSWLIWLGVMIVLIVVELITVDLVAVWFALASLLMVIITAIFPQMFFVWQFCIFLVVSTIAVLSTRKLVKKLMQRKKDQETNLELIVNHTGRVVEEIVNDLERGAVKINGIIWNARTENGETVAVDELVNVIQIKGNKLIVEKKNKNEKGE